MDRNSNKVKFEGRIKKNILLGYFEKSKGYRVWLAEGKRTEILGDVKLKKYQNRPKRVFEDYDTENLKENWRKMCANSAMFK